MVDSFDYKLWAPTTSTMRTLIYAVSLRLLFSVFLYYWEYHDFKPYRWDWVNTNLRWKVFFWFFLGELHFQIAGNTVRARVQILVRPHFLQFSQLFWLWESNINHLLLKSQQRTIHMWLSLLFSLITSENPQDNVLGLVIQVSKCYCASINLSLYTKMRH